MGGSAGAPKIGELDGEGWYGMAWGPKFGEEVKLVVVVVGLEIKVGEAVGNFGDCVIFGA